jgi:16S rRNA (uracil1498-N3)-methyltransferase
MDLVVEKCVELGAAGLVVVDCERCQRRDSVARLERWRRVAVEAMKQSLQAHLPEIAWASALSGALAGAARLESSLVALGPGEHPRLGDVLAAGRPSSVGIWVGPEGGFSEEEIGLLAAAGAVPFRLSDSRLRSETAAIASVAAVRAVLG